VLRFGSGTMPPALHRRGPGTWCSSCPPFADAGTHQAFNGSLMLRDIHGLFDAGNVMVANPENSLRVGGCSASH
jgi:hypothetical protein